VPARVPTPKGSHKEADFVYHPATGDADAPGDYCICPDGQPLSCKKDGGCANGLPYRVYAAATASCKACPAKALFTKKRGRKLHVSIQKEAIDRARERMEGGREMALRRGSLAGHPLATLEDTTGSRTGGDRRDGPPGRGPARRTARIR